MAKKRREEREPWEYLGKKHVLWKQIIALLLSVIALFLIVVLGDFLFHCFHLGKDWSDSLLVRMIVERRMILPFFR
ncbi:hypothetical protein [Aminivibrio sp.]|uniref:hypothetical protein n=1 Tax=Aminivibrio sp. TaxID=1872489 RepID=UPI00345E64A2